MTLATDDSWRVRCIVAEKRSVDRAVRELLAKDEHEGVRSAIAWNRKTPTDILRKMINDPIARIAEYVKERLVEVID
ncbi:MAG: hypothetical protein ABIQ57_11415 [Candidatus Kapaibacterium sp.]